MSAKPVRLSAHKSQIERIRRRAIRREMVQSANAVNNYANIVAYALIAFSDDGRAFVDWNTGGIMPMWAFPSTVREVLQADIEQSCVEEDFKSPLIDRRWKGSK